MHCLEIIIKKNREAAESQLNSGYFEKTSFGLVYVPPSAERSLRESENRFRRLKLSEG